MTEEGPDKKVVRFPTGEPVPEEGALVEKETELTPEQRELLPDCKLTIKKEFYGVGGYQEIIQGVVKGQSVVIIFNSTLSWKGVAAAKVDGKNVSTKESAELREKYKAIAEHLTKKT